MKKTKLVIFLIVSMFVLASFVGCSAENNHQNTDNSPSENMTSASESFPNFQGMDFDGNAISESIFEENKVTVLSFWFNGCTACVNEMPDLEAFNQELKEMGAEIIGVNTEAANGDQQLQEAKDILKKQGCTFRNIVITDGEEAQKFVSKIMAFPTTILVNQNGKIIGEPITGSIESKEKQQKIVELIQNAISDSAMEQEVTNMDTSVGNESNNAEASTDMSPELTALYDDLNGVFSEHYDLWMKVLMNAPKDKIDQIDVEISYPEYLTKALENTADLTPEEIEQISKDIEKIGEIDSQIQQLESESNK